MIKGEKRLTLDEGYTEEDEIEREGEKLIEGIGERMAERMRERMNARKRE